MIEMLHNEARKLLIEALEKKHRVQEVADCYSVNRSTIYRLKKRWKETGSIETRIFLRGRKPALSPEKLASIDQLVKTNPISRCRKSLIHCISPSASRQSERRC